MNQIPPLDEQLAESQETPLTWEKGYVHERCGCEEAEKMRFPYIGAYCPECGRTVPVAELKKL